MNPQLEQLIAGGLARLHKNGIETSRYEVRLLLEYALGMALSDFTPSDILSDKQAERFDAALEKRCHHMPVDKIIGRRGFYKYDFAVSRDVLSPRPDTELLVEAALDSVRNNDYKNILEFGVGSGCIIFSVLAELPALEGIAVDISAAALKVAAANADSLGVATRVKLINASWDDENIISVIGRKFDLILSNPPYIPSSEIKSLDCEVKDYDPLTALDGGADGLNCYRRLAEIVPLLLSEGGSLILECGEGQAKEVAALFEKQGLILQKILRDLNNIERCVILKK